MKMPSFINKLRTRLISNGLSDYQAGQILISFVEGESGNSMSSRLHDSAEDYPEGLFNVLWALCLPYALAYIDSNCPKAWFRPVFLPQEQLKTWMEMSNN